MAHEKKKVTEREPWNPATTNLEVPVVGCVVQRGVIVQPLGVDFCTCSQQLLCHVVVSPVACLVQRRPACEQTDTERWASPSWRGSEREKQLPSTTAACARSLQPSPAARGALQDQPHLPLGVHHGQSDRLLEMAQPWQTRGQSSG